MRYQKFSKTLVLSVLSLSMGFGAMGINTVAAESDTRSVPEIEWDTQLEKFQFDQDKFIGQRFTAKCPPVSVREKESLPSQDGTTLYSNDHSICMAGFQAGQIDTDGGTVTVQLNPEGSVGVGSSARTTARTIAVVKESGSEATDQIHLEYLPRLKWDTKFTTTGFAHKQMIGQRFTFNCPAAPSDMLARRIVGTDLYAFSSVVCQAAVHSGKITTDGGMVTVQMNPSKKKLVGSIRNGVETKNGTSGLSAISFVSNPVKP